MLTAKTKYPRKYLAEIGFASSAVSLCSTILESSHLMMNRPNRADYAVGLVYPFKVKGPEVYISASDANCVSLCLLFLILSFGCIAYAIGPRNTATDVTSNSDGSFSVGNGNRSLNLGAVFLISIVVLAGGFFLFGRWTGDFLAAHGVVLHFYSHDLSRRN